MIDRKCKVTLGGLPQKIHVKGDETKPVLLFLHGGPGVCNRHTVMTVHADLQKEFLVVAWDQRGSGGSYRGAAVETLTIDRLVDDAHELVLWLCREYGRRNRVSFQNNPYVREAANFVNQEMNGIDSYCIDWRLFTPKKATKKKWPCLAVFTSIEFYQPVQLVESLYNIRTYYMQALEKLKKELQSSQMKTLYLTEVSQAAERKAA